jgi:predicted nuclease of restriction endonuclease-like (RecB) superfamily
MVNKRTSRGQQKERRTLGRQREEALFPIAPLRAELPHDYPTVLNEIRSRIQQERLRVVMAANSALVLLYWDIGHMILQRQDSAGWGARVIDRLFKDLRDAFPDTKGFSPRNLKYMRAFAAAWPERAIVQQLAAQIPWFHNCVLLDRVADPTEREWYIRQSIAHGWSRSILVLQLDSQAFQRVGKAISNFSATLPPADSDMASQIFKDSYLFDFLGTADPRRERLEVGDQDFYIDLLFYHLKLHSYVVIELKAVPFKPTFVGCHASTFNRALQRDRCKGET